MWLGPPQLKIMMTERALPLRAGWDAARAHCAHEAAQAPAANFRTVRRDDFADGAGSKWRRIAGIQPSDASTIVDI
jgi:hypothetical protein